MASVGLLCHLGDGAGEPPRSVVGDAPVEVEVAGLPDDDVRELLLGDRIAYLDRGHGARRIKGFRGEGCAVDTVFPDPSADHDDEVAGQGLLLVEQSPVVSTRHHADRACEDERFTHVPVVEVAPPLRCRYARTVAADADAADDALKDPSRGEDGVFPVLPAEEGRFGVGVAGAVAVYVDAGFGAEAEPDRVAVHPDDPGEGAAEGVEGRGGVVRLDLAGHEVFVVEDDGAGVVGEDRDADVRVPPLLADGVGGRLDAGLVEPPRDVVVHRRRKDGVLAVFAPGLGEGLDLDVRRHPPEPPEVVPYRVELGEVERERSPPLSCPGIEDTLFSDAREVRVGKIEAHGPGRLRVVEMDEGRDRIHPLLAVLLAAFDVDAVDERVCEGAGEFFQGFGSQVAGGEVELR